MIFAILISAGCGAVPKQAGTEPVVVAGHETSVDIAYVLGHNRHRFWAQSDASRVEARTYLDRQIVEEAGIDRARYLDFLEKAKTFVQSPRRSPASNTVVCRTPFTVTVRVGKDAYVATGCRGVDKGALGRLVREGEFLLYSKK
ncbi:MAG: hypothetical protein A2428_12750 [Bdellovibrionales bacterium RIFOXYC1_FULL_54_43]|nr:MAG: hypothetical protein A2428_12750 [Bdellovibrionales bacterium RIFOXYC1_FULL_54_43]